jgi:ABC-type Zn uptake system ZnuABC Zn-binding protein ZnuA
MKKVFNWLPRSRQGMKFLSRQGMTFSFILCLLTTHFSFAQEIKKLDIVTTVPYLTDVVNHISCQNKQIHVHSLIPIGVDPHTYMLTPSQRMEIKKAQILIQIGAHLEPWLDKINNESNQIRIVLSSQINFSEVKEVHSLNQDGFLLDPHIWQSPSLTKKTVQVISKELIQTGVENKKQIQMCTQNYLKEINDAVKQMNKTFSLLPENKKILATNHDSLGYFAKEFGFKIYTLLGMSDEDSPTISQLNNLINQLKQDKVSAIFLESTGNIKNIQTISENAHVKIGGKLYGDSLGSLESGANTTINMWKTNANTIVEGLK